MLYALPPCSIPRRPNRPSRPPAAGASAPDDEHRDEMQDVLRAPIRSMGGMGTYERFAVEVCCYGVRVKTQDALLHLRAALSRVAEHLRQGRRQAAA
jgi:hypothetical protein